MYTIEEKVISDLKEIHDGFKELQENGSGEIELVFEDGRKVGKSEIDEDTKTYQIIEIYEQMAT